MRSISIHAPVKGATIIQTANNKSKLDFNPRTREGCDVQIGHTEHSQSTISIHAPVKGATKDTGDKAILQELFQSTHP